MAKGDGWLVVVMVMVVEGGDPKRIDTHTHTRDTDADADADTDTDTDTDRAMGNNTVQSKQQQQIINNKDTTRHAS